MKISVILATYNDSEYIIKQLESLHLQILTAPCTRFLLSYLQGGFYNPGSVPPIAATEPVQQLNVFDCS